MVARTLDTRIHPPKMLPPRPFRELVKPSYVQIATAKTHVAALSAHRDYIQSHIDALEGDLASLDPADVAKVVIPGYPPPKGKHS